MARSFQTHNALETLHTLIFLMIYDRVYMTVTALPPPQKLISMQVLVSTFIISVQIAQTFSIL